MKEIEQLVKKTKEKRPLVHCITNPISINQCANGVLAAGGRPIMAEHPDEVEGITDTSDSLVLNLGNITDVRIKSISLSAQVAADKNIPFVLDAVGIACSGLRRNLATEIAMSHHPTVIKGNYSEIYALYNPDYRSLGVDSEDLNTNSVSKVAVMLAQKYNTIILASGKTDIVTDGQRLIYVNNGTSQLSSVTGTGCMLGALCGCYLSVCPDIRSAVCACGVLGICGELAKTDKGNGSFMVNLMDNLSVMDGKTLKKHLKLEEKEIEKP